MIRLISHHKLCVAASIAALLYLLVLGHYAYTEFKFTSTRTTTTAPTVVTQKCPKCGPSIEEIEENLIQRRLKESEVIWRKGMMNREQAARKIKLPDGNNLGKHSSTILWDFFYPEFTCPHILERMGRVGDGGKWICGINQLVRKGSGCVVYSYGMGDESSFEDEILRRTDCFLHGFDHTIDTDSNPLPRKYPGRVTMSKIGLGVSNIDDLRTLKSEMDSRGHKFIDVLKIDVEGAEIEALTQIIKDFPNGLPFGQLLMEIHLKKFSQKNLFAILKVWWDELEKAGLRAYHSEPNLYNQAQPNQLSPLYYEYSFLNIKTDHVILHA